MYRLVCILVLLSSSLSASGQQQADPMAVLAKARERLLSDVQRLPRYACVQTIHRDYFATPFRYQRPGSCKEVITEHDKRTHELTLISWDRLHLDVAVSGSHEIFSWVGAPRLGEATLAAIAGKGPLGSGDFGPFITSVFTMATVKFEKDVAVDGRRLLEYSYDVPQDISRYQILDSNRNTTTMIAYSGTFLLDPADSDLVRLTIRTAELPPETNKCQAITEVNYARVLIHNTQTLLPHETRLRVLGRLGEEALAITSYADCHEYSSKAVLHFEPAEITESAGTNSSSAPAENVFPSGLHLDLRLVTPIDSDTAAAGDPLDAVLRSPIRDKRGVLLASAGAHLHGRLVQVEHIAVPRAAVQIGIDFDSIDINGKSVPIGVILDQQNMAITHYLGVYMPANVVNGQFLFFGEHLKLSHLDIKGATAAPAAEKKPSGK
jgi:hypothetical protein